ncbi:TolC family protein [Flammeovirgaceae bacterium SG7u.111]|nr:TolC family protein [Flammeovirgaceae bacterium SG7u.132]WPO37747.1 TolC family protein [Flammeovirgaceae bacterium SG7u.111]
MKNRYLIVLISTILSVNTSFGQDTLTISRDDILSKISQENLQVKIAEKTFESAKADYNQSRSLFLPNVSVSHTAILTTNPLMAFGSKLNQQILTPSDFNPDLLNNPDKIDNYSTAIEVQQPIFNLDGVYERKAAKTKMQAYQLQAERTKEYIKLEVSKAYMQLQMAYSAVKVLEKANATSEASLQLVENYFKQGMLQKTDLLSVQVRANEVKNQLQYANSNVKNASDYLAFLLNEENSTVIYKPAEELASDIELKIFDTSLSEARKDIMAIDLSTQAYENMLQSSKMKFLPRLNAFGSYLMNDDRLFQMGAGGYLVGAQLSWNLFDGYKSIGKMEKQKVEFQKAQVESTQYKSQSQLEINKTHRQLRDAYNKVNLSKLALEQSREAYRIRSDRFQQGLEKTTDLLQSETQMIQKELEILQAVFEYNFTQQYLEFLTK